MVSSFKRLTPESVYPEFFPIAMVLATLLRPWPPFLRILSCHVQDNSNLNSIYVKPVLQVIKESSTISNLSYNLQLLTKFISMHTIHDFKGGFALNGNI